MARSIFIVGFDQGMSERRRSSGFVLTQFEKRTLVAVDGPFHLSRSSAVRVLASVVREERVAAVVIDAPIARSTPTHYRPVERVFSLGKFQRICKPGSSGSPVGRALAAAASESLRALGATAGFVPFNQLGSRHQRIPVLEIFPTAALAVLESPEHLPQTTRKHKTDHYFEHVLRAHEGLLGNIRLAPELISVSNHDERMAVICATAAAWYVAGHYSAVGDAANGYFLMPPLKSWDAQWRDQLRLALAREPRASCFDSAKV